VDDAALMAQAVALGARHHPHPNPRVGAVIVGAGGEVVGTGGHVSAGTPHAEIIALAQAGARARGGTVAVTLEPCAHRGRTQPCASALIDAGVKRVVIGVIDPDERVAGRGAAALREAGIDVSVIGGEDLEEIDPGYFHHRRTGRPRVTLKLAMTLDGQVGAADGTSQWITSPESRSDAHRLRSESDAVMVGAGTVLADDPRLTVRLPGFDREQPKVVVVGGTRPLPRTARVFAGEPIVYSPRPIDIPGEVVIFPSDGDRVHLPSMIADLGKRGIVDLLVEGGPRLAGALMGEGLVDRVVFYYGGAIAGGTGKPAFEGSFPSIGSQVPVNVSAVAQIGRDIRVEGEVG
jgi:diaminohydroxyphosphoribosylaminopyrimidine deaminase/5-amino-6-(5-phosphoribosylamino)uracil reductase